MQNPDTTKRLWIAVPLVVFWLGSTVYAFWWFQMQDLRPFDASAETQAAVFQGGQLASKLNTLLPALSAAETGQTLPGQTISGQTMMVHFWNPGCSCNKFNNGHVRDIIAQYQANGIRFITVVKSQAGADNSQRLARAQEIFNVPALLDTSLQLDLASAPSATPAAAVVNAQGQLAYFGPYSDSAFCGSRSSSNTGASFVETALDQILEGRNPEKINTLAFGCFCEWKPGASALII